MSVVLTRGVHLYQSEQAHAVLTERQHRIGESRRGVVALAGKGGDDMDWFIEETASDTTDVDLTYSIAEAGMPLVSMAVDETWGNSVMRTRITDALAYARANQGLSAEPVFLFAASMGSLCALNWARFNPSEVAALALLIPAVDVQDLHANDRGGNAASIEAAFGGAPPDSENPAKNAADHARMPVKLWYSTDDVLVIPQTVEDFAAGVGESAELRSLGDQGHSALTVPVEEVVRFLQEHA